MKISMTSDIDAKDAEQIAQLMDHSSGASISQSVMLESGTIISRNQCYVLHSKMRGSQEQDKPELSSAESLLQFLDSQNDVSYYMTLFHENIETSTTSGL